jgi:hypothetical protein
MDLLFNRFRQRVLLIHRAYQELDANHFARSQGVDEC